MIHTFGYREITIMNNINTWKAKEFSLRIGNRLNAKWLEYLNSGGDKISDSDETIVNYFNNYPEEKTEILAKIVVVYMGDVNDLKHGDSYLRYNNDNTLKEVGNYNITAEDKKTLNSFIRKKRNIKIKTLKIELYLIPHQTIEEWDPLLTTQTHRLITFLAGTKIKGRITLYKENPFMMIYDVCNQLENGGIAKVISRDNYKELIEKIDEYCQLLLIDKNGLKKTNKILEWINNKVSNILWVNEKHIGVKKNAITEFIIYLLKEFCDELEKENIFAKCANGKYYGTSRLHYFIYNGKKTCSTKCTRAIYNRKYQAKLKKK